MQLIMMNISCRKLLTYLIHKLLHLALVEVDEAQLRTELKALPYGQGWGVDVKLCASHTHTHTHTRSMLSANC